MHTSIFSHLWLTMFMFGYVLSLGGSHVAAWKIATIASAAVLFVLLACLFLWWKRGRNIKGKVPWISFSDYSLAKAHSVVLQRIVCTRLHVYILLWWLVSIVKCP